jgi:hypothetical protein
MRRVSFSLWLTKGYRLTPSLDNMLHRLNVYFQPQKKNQSLENVLDDTPIESFLRNISDQVEAMENNLYTTLVDLPGHNRTEAIEKARYFGRIMAQEAINNGSISEAESTDGPTALSLARSLIGGGEWLQKYFLIRRVTYYELSYECLYCPHQRLKTASKQCQDWACQLEQSMYRGFFETTWPRAAYERVAKPYHCVDFVSNQR